MHFRSPLGTLVLGLSLSFACSRPQAQTPESPTPKGETASPAPKAPKPEPQQATAQAGDVPEVGEGGDQEQALRELEHAALLLRQFLKKAEGQAEYAEAVDRARERLDELEETIAAVEQGLALERAGRAAPQSP